MPIFDSPRKGSADFVCSRRKLYEVVCYLGALSEPQLSPGVIESVPFARSWTSAVGCIMASHGGSGVIGHSIKVVNSVV